MVNLWETGDIVTLGAKPEKHTEVPSHCFPRLMNENQSQHQGLMCSGHSLFLFGLSVREEDRFVFSSQLPTFPIVLINLLSSSL